LTGREGPSSRSTMSSGPGSRTSVTIAIPSQAALRSWSFALGHGCLCSLSTWVVRAHARPPRSSQYVIVSDSRLSPEVYPDAALARIAPGNVSAADGVAAALTSDAGGGTEGAVLASSWLRGPAGAVELRTLEAGLVIAGALLVRSLREQAHIEQEMKTRYLITRPAPRFDRARPSWKSYSSRRYPHCQCSSNPTSDNEQSVYNRQHWQRRCT